MYFVDVLAHVLQESFLAECVERVLLDEFVAGLVDLVEGLVDLVDL